MVALSAVEHDQAVNPWRATLSGLCAIVVGLGLARFAYTPLIPALIGAGWFSPSDAVYLGAANFAGYLAGALSARAIAQRSGATVTLRTMMLLVAASFVAGATPLSFLWFFAWRFASGLAGGVLMVLGPTAVLAQIPPARRGLAGGGIFAGVGIGIIASGTAVPLLMTIGLPETWLSLGAISLVLALLGWGGWPPAANAAPAARTQTPDTPPRSRPLRAFYVEYGLSAAGLVPHMVFLVDFVARGVGEGLDAGARIWVIFGIGAVLGPVMAGHLADRIGFGRALRLAFLVEAVAVLLPVLSDGAVALTVSSLLVGAFVPGVAGLAVGRVHELVAGDETRRQTAWGICTTAFSIGQAVAAYAMSWLFAAHGSYAALFAIGAAMLLLCLVLDLIFTPAKSVEEKQ